MLNPVSRDLSFLHDFSEFYVAGFRFSDTFLQYWGLKPSDISLVFWLLRGSEILNPVSRDLSFLHGFAEFYVAGFRFSDTFLQYWVLKPSEITLVFWLLRGSEILNPVSPDLSRQ
jgi:cellulose synthase/poly-beta-1,6-N-acetylglucosamine synthase-like glycosyltransferase